MEKNSRRKVLKLFALAAVGVATASSLSSSVLGVPVTDRPAPTKRRGRYVMVIDLSKCNGCGECTEACITYHHLDKGQEFIKVFKMKDALGSEYFLPRPCMMCQNPPCVNVCPVGAAYIREDGIVLIDHERCIGCRFCMAACPYSARYFNWGEPDQSPIVFKHQPNDEEPWPHLKGTTEKCDFCPERLREGKLPVCASSCPQKALYFGDRFEDVVTNGEETVKFTELIRKSGGFRYMEGLGTDPSVYYLPPRRE